MKRFLPILFLLFTLTLNCYADENLTFLYINGSNNNNEKMKNWYINGVNKLHPVIKRKFEKNSTIKKWNNDNKLVINSKPQIFFWGYDSKSDLDFVKDRLNFSKAYSSVIAYEVRSLMTQFMHDAIWVQKEHNMLPILDALNEQVKNLSDKNQNVVLYGYSAGTFITFEYIIYKLPYINLANMFKLMGANQEIIDFANSNPQEKTCLSALLDGKGNIGTMSNTGHFILNQNTEDLKQNYLKLNEATKQYCAPPNRVKAIVNFASPLPLFYSDIADENYELTYFNIYATKYLIENGMYFLTVNFREDPLGFPSSDNLTLDEMEKVLDVKFENPTGVIYDNSRVWSKRSAFLAHTSYWSARGTFANAITKSFVIGTKFLYDEKYQKKHINKIQK